MTLHESRTAPDVTLGLPTVAKQNWKSKACREAWADRLRPFPRAFDRAAEAALTDEDHPRTALQLTFPTDDALDVLARVPAELDVARDSHDGTTRLVLAARDCPADAEDVLGNELDPVEAQRVRGVPECCARAYDDHRQEGHADPIAGIARSTPSTVERGGELVVEAPHPILNPLWSYLGWRFVDFYPCSFECDRARAVAIETGRILRETGRADEAEAAFEFLAEPTYWSGYHGLAHVKNGWHRRVHHGRLLARTDRPVQRVPPGTGRGVDGRVRRRVARRRVSSGSPRLPPSVPAAGSLDSPLSGRGR